MSEGSGCRPKEPGRGWWLLVALVVVLGLGLRVGYVLTREPALSWPDAEHYHRVARNFLQGDGLILDDHHKVERPPLYPLFLAGLYLLNHHLHLTDDVLLVRLVQALVGAATVLLIWWTTRRLFGGRAALLSAIFAALYPFFIYYTGVLLSETLAVFLVTLVLAVLVAIWDEKALHYSVAAGAALGLLCLTRASFLLAPPVLVVVWVVIRRPRKRALLESVMMVVVWLGVLFPWVLRNYVVTQGRFVPGTLTAGWSLYEAAGPGADGGPRMERTPWPREVWPREGSKLDEYEADRLLRRLALEHVRQHPGEAAGLALVKLKRLWNVFPNFAGYQSPLYLAASALGYLPVLVLALTGVVAARRSWRRWLVLLLPAAYLTCIHTVFVGSIRYRVPAMPGVLVLAGAGGSALLSVLWPKRSEGSGRRRRWPWLLLMLLLLVVGGLAVAVKVLLRPEYVRARLVAELSRLWGAPVTVGQARFGALSGLEARDVRFYSPEDQERVILLAGRMEASHDLRALSRGRLAFDQVVFRDGELLLRRSERGWDLPEGVFEKREGPGGVVPQVVLKGLRLHFEEEVEEGWKSTELGSLVGQGWQEADGSFRAVFRLRGEVVGDWHLKVTAPRGEERVRVSASCPQFRFTPESLAALPADLVRVVRKFAPQGTASVEVSAEVVPDEPAEGPVVISFEGPSLAYEKFPYRADWTRGRIVCSRGVATLTAGEARAGNVRATLSGTVSLPGQPKHVELALQATSTPLDRTLRDALPSRYHRTWDEFRPQGTVAVSGRIYADETTEGKTKVALEVEALDCALDYVRFPYRLVSLRGRADYDRGSMVIRQLTGRTPAGALVRISGSAAGLDTPEPDPDIVVEADRLPLDGHLRAAFQPQYQELWNRLQPSGEVAARCRVRRPAADGPVEVAVQARLQGVTITDREFPYRLDDVGGELTYQGGKVELVALKGRHGPATVDFSGSLWAGAATEIDLEVSGVELPLDSDLKDALPPRIQEVWEQLNLQGTVTVACELTGSPEEPKKTIHVKTSSGRISYEGFPYPLTDLEGELVYEDGRLTWLLRGAKGEKTRVTTYGSVDSLAQEPTARWGIQARDVVLDQPLLQALGEQPMLARVWKYVEVQPGSTGDVDCSFRYQGGQTFVDGVEVTLKKASVLYRSLPYPLERVRGRIIYEPEPEPHEHTLTLKGLRGERGSAWIEVADGWLDNLEGEPTFEFFLRAQDVPLDEELRALLPAGHRELWDRLAPSGRLSFPEEDLVVSGGPSGADRKLITYRGEVTVEDVAFTLGLEFEGLTGKLTLDGKVESRRVPSAEGGGGPAAAGDSEAEDQTAEYQVVSHRYGGTARLRELVASNKRLEGVAVTFRKEGSLLGFSDLTAAMYGGRLDGAVRLELEPETVSYGCRLHLSAVELGPFVRDTFDYAGEELAGSLQAEVIFQGIGASRRDLVGQGSFTISEGKMYRMPLLLRILNLLQLSLPEESAFSRAAIEYDLLDQALLINELSLGGRGLNVFGTGRVSPENQLDLVLYSGFGRGELPHVPLLSDFVELVGKQLVRLRVTGSFGEPEVTVEPLTPLSGPLFGLFRSLTKEPAEETSVAEQP